MENIITLCIVFFGILMYLIGALLSGTFRLTNPFHTENETPKMPVRKIRVICISPNPDEHSAAAS